MALVTAKSEGQTGPKIDLKEAIVRDWRNPGRLKEHFDTWVKSQPPAMAVALATVAGSGQGAFLGGLMGSMTKLDPSMTNTLTQAPGTNPDMAKQMAALQAGGPMVQARNFAVMTGVNAGLAAACKLYRGKDDIYGTMIAAFGSGAAFSLVSGMATAGNPLQSALTTGVFFALIQGGFYKVGQQFGGGAKTEAVEYARGRYMLQTLGLTKYEKNLQKGLLTDPTIMLWNDSALSEVKIPPGPRLLILAHLERMRHVLKPGMPFPGPPLPPAAPALP